jgi:hypothetical protein
MDTSVGKSTQAFLSPKAPFCCAIVTTASKASGFPQKLREDPLLLDKLRRQLSSELSVLSDRSQQERLLLQIAVGAASRRLYLSYPRLEVAEARARVPSFYALDVARSITRQVPHATRLRQSTMPNMTWPRYGSSSIRTNRGRDGLPMS